MHVICHATQAIDPVFEVKNWNVNAVLFVKDELTPSFSHHIFTADFQLCRRVAQQHTLAPRDATAHPRTKANGGVFHERNLGSSRSQLLFSAPSRNKSCMIV
jgi:hypothetical protein